jgi:flagellar hook-associated protein 2
MSTIQRITGMNSGLDVDALVKASLTSYQSKIDTATQKQKILEYQQEQYKQIMSDASDFYDKYFDILKTGNLFSSSTYESVSFKSGDDTKVMAKGFAGADVSDYKVTTTQLANKAVASFKTENLIGHSLYVKVGSEEISVDITDTGDSETDMATAVKNLNIKLNDAGIDVSAKYSEFSDSIVLESGTMGESVSFQAGVDSSYTTYTGKNAKGVITKGTETYTINQASNVLTVDNVQFTFKSPSTSVVATDLTALTTEDSGVTVSADGKTITSEDGKITTVTSDDGTVTTTKVDTTTGAVTQTITKGTTTTTNTYTSVSLSGSTDVTALKDKIVSFVNDYNTLLSSINTKLYEERDTDYMPLTDAQKEEMSDADIEKWEKKAKTGLIRKDNDLERITNAMKSAMSSVMSGSGLYLEKIGISPVQDYAEKNGMYTIDEDKLTQGLEENAGNIKDLFTRAASTTSTTDKGGIFTQLKSTLKSEFKTSTASLSKKVGLDGTSTQYSNTITKSITEKKQLISDLNDLYTDKETALYKKYSALETALETLNAQQSSLASMLGTS